MIRPPAARPDDTSAERPASNRTGMVWLRDSDGDGGIRIPQAIAKALLAGKFADRVSAAGHLRLRPGIRMPQVLATVHGILAIENSRLFRGDQRTAADIRNRDRGRGLRWERPRQEGGAE